MDRYTAAGIAVDVEDGYKIGVLAPGAMLRQSMDEVRQRLDPDAAKVTLTNGSERISHASGGWVRFFRTAESMRGYACDVVVAHGACVNVSWEQTLPMLASSNMPGRGFMLTY